MTLPSAISKSQHVGNPPTAGFSTNFVFWAPDDLTVVLTSAAGVDTTWTRGTQYTVTGGKGLTGTVVVKTTPVNYTPQVGETLTILSALSDTQPTALPLGGGFPSPAVELRFDQIVRLIQQKAEELGRSIKLKASTAVTGLEIPDPEDGKFLRGNATNDGYENVDVAGQGALALPLVVTLGGTGATNAVDARTSLGVAAMTDAEKQRLVRAQRLALFHHGGL